MTFIPTCARDVSSLHPWTLEMWSKSFALRR